MKFFITKAKEEDLEGINKVTEVTWVNTYPSDEFGISVNDIKEIDFYNKEKEKKYKKLLKDKECGAWVVKSENEVVGFCKASKKEGILKINAIYVLPKFQGKRIGKSLIEKSLNWIGSGEVQVLVAVHNKQAIAFYEKFGFEKVSDVKIEEWYKLPSGKLFPIILMVKQ